MRRTAALYGILGLVLLAFGLVDLYIAPGFRFFVFVNLIAGVFAIVLWITSSRSALASLVGRRSARYGANAVIYSVAFIGILVALNYLAHIHHRRLDLTTEKIFSLSSQSDQVVKQLKEPLKLIGFFQGGENEQARQLFASYSYASPKVSYQIVDPDKHPELAERYKVSVMGTTHIQYGGGQGEGTNVTELSEEALTNGIIRVTKSGKKVIDFLDGHGEADPDNTKDATGLGSLKKDLEGEGFEVHKLLLASLDKVPDDVTMVAIAGPVKPLLPVEIDRLNAYLKRGGRLLVMLRPPRPDEPIDEKALIGLLGQWHIKVGDDVVVDQVVRLFAGPALGLNPLVNDYGQSPITRDFKQRTVFPMTRSLSLDTAGAKPGLQLTWLARTSDTSWGETDLDGIFRRQEAKLDDKDIRGPITVAAQVDANLSELGWGKGDARMVVFGSTEFANNQYLDNFFNRDFLINSADWLAGEENAISIRPREMRASRFRLTVDQFSVVFALSVLLLPELLLVAGIAVWWERRH
jgi:gliding motility-associatede transport system auxiliary component